MRVLPVLLLGATWLGAFPSAPALAQERIRVVVSIPDSQAVLKTALTGALRRLGDVDVVTRSEAHDFRLLVAANCSPDCREPGRYDIALALTEPMDSLHTDTLMSPRYLMLRVVVTESYHLHKLWSLQWPASQVDPGASDIIAEINVECFDALRLRRRINEHNRLALVKELESKRRCGVYTMFRKFSRRYDQS